MHTKVWVSENEVVNAVMTLCPRGFEVVKDDFWDGVCFEKKSGLDRSDLVHIAVNYDNAQLNQIGEIGQNDIDLEKVKQEIVNMLSRYQTFQKLYDHFNYVPKMYIREIIQNLACENNGLKQNFWDRSFKL